MTAHDSVSPLLVLHAVRLAVIIVAYVDDPCHKAIHTSELLASE